jgi:hypothetical protein
MGPLVYYCRWRGAKLRLLGRNAELVWGQLVSTNGEVETTETFRFNTRTWLLTLGEEEAQEIIQLDELGVAIPPGSPAPFTTNAGAEP